MTTTAISIFDIRTMEIFASFPGIFGGKDKCGCPCREYYVPKCEMSYVQQCRMEHYEEVLQREYIDKFLFWPV